MGNNISEESELTLAERSLSGEGIFFEWNLPVEMILMVLSFVGYKDVCQKISLLNKRWNFLAMEENLWKIFYQRRFRNIDKTFNGQTWKQIFKEDYLHTYNWNEKCKSSFIVLSDNGKTVTSTGTGRWSTCQLGQKPIPHLGKFSFHFLVNETAPIIFALVEDTWNFNYKLGISSYPGGSHDGITKRIGQQDRPVNCLQIAYYDHFLKGDVVSMKVDADDCGVKFIVKNEESYESYKEHIHPMIVIVSILQGGNISCVAERGQEV